VTRGRAAVTIAVAVGLFAGGFYLGRRSWQLGRRVVVHTLRTYDEFTFRGLHVVLVDVVEKDPNSDRDEDVTLLIDTPTTCEQRTIRELRAEIVDRYRIWIIEAKAGSNPPASGRAQIEVSDLGPNGGRQARALALAQAGDVVVRTLRAAEEFTFRDLLITLVDVVENDPNIDRDEDVTLLIDTPKTSEESTIEELRSEFVDNYRVRIIDARARGNAPNSGLAEIEITDLGAGRSGAGVPAASSLPLS
jgi:hypothetical protein